MSWLPSFRALSLAALLGSAPATLAAAPVGPDQQATGTTTILAPLGLQKLQDMDFGALTGPAGGTAVLDPTTGAITTTGGLVAAGGAPQPAAFRGLAARRTPVIIRLPKTASTLTRAGGTETITVSNWTLDGKATREAESGIPFEFKVGGTLNVGPNQAEGIYVGSFEVTVQYP